MELSDIPSPYPQQVTHIYSPPENTYRGFTYQTLDIYGGISQVGFMRGSEANSLLQDSLKALGTVDIPVPSVTLHKTLDIKQNIAKKEENIRTSEAEIQSVIPEQNFIIPPTKQNNPLSPSGYYFPPIQVNHFQAGASYFAPPFFNGQPNFLNQFGYVSMSETPSTSKLRDEDTGNSDNGLSISSVNDDSVETKSDSSTEELRSIENVEPEDSSTSLSVSNENTSVTTEINNGLSVSTESEELSTSTPSGNENSTAKDNDSIITTDQPVSPNDSENVLNQESTIDGDESRGSNTSETTTTTSDNSTEENSTTESSE